jgi:hypothetical protein
MHDTFLIILVATVASEYCMGHDSDCGLERCPHGYVVKCLPDNVCSCEHAGLYLFIVDISYLSCHKNITTLLQGEMKQKIVPRFLILSVF